MNNAELAKKKLAFIHEHLAAGRNVYIASALKVWKLSKSTPIW